MPGLSAIATMILGLIGLMLLALLIVVAMAVTYTRVVVRDDQDDHEHIRGNPL
jgi:uncharacterized protein YpmS